MIQPLHDIDQADGIHVKHRRRIGIVAHLGRIAGDAQNIAQADRRGAQQIRLDGENVAVAAGVMQNVSMPVCCWIWMHRLCPLMRAEARGESYTLMACTPSCASMPRAFNLLRAVDALGRNNLHQGDKFPAAISDPRRDRSASGAGGVSLVCSGCAPRTSTRACASSARMAARMARMWLGVVPQQPPTICAPRRSPCAQSWPCIPASRDRCCGPPRRAACRHWAWPPAAALWPRAWLQLRSAPWSAR